MKINITIDQKTIERLIAEYVQRQLGDAAVKSVRLLVKSKQNYRSVWEQASVIVTSDGGEEAQQSEGTELKAEVE